MFDSFRNENGTYDGVKMLAAISGVCEREVAWSFARLKQLIVVEKRTASEARQIVSTEAKDKPWLK